MTDLSRIRREYMSQQLEREDLKDDPVAMFQHWLTQAEKSEVVDYTAMTVATVDDRSMPYQRVVLLKAFDERGFVFYTNLESRKANHLEHNGQISLHFAWLELNRQVTINGVAEQVPTAEAIKYFVSRPKESQIGAWASHQSQPISTRALLEEKFLEFKRKFSDGDITMPKFWGGFRVKPEQFEFWQGRPNRLHDRFIYTKQDNDWDIQRWQP